MTDVDALAVIREAVAIVLEVPGESVDPSQHLARDLRADSIALVEIADIVEGELARTHPGFVIEDPELDAFTTVQSFVDYCQTRLTR